MAAVAAAEMRAVLVTFSPSSDDSPSLRHVLLQRGLARVFQNFPSTKYRGEHDGFLGQLNVFDDKDEENQQTRRGARLLVETNTRSRTG